MAQGGTPADDLVHTYTTEDYATPGTPQIPSQDMASSSPNMWTPRIGGITFSFANTLSPLILEKITNFKILSKAEEEKLKSLDYGIQMMNANSDLIPEAFTHDEGEGKEYLDPRSLSDPGVQNLSRSLLDWLNVSLSSHDNRILLSDLRTDLSDGQVLKLILEKVLGLEKISLPCGDFVQSRDRQRINLEFVLVEVTKVLELKPDQVEWSLDAVHEGEMLAIFRLLLKIISHCVKNNRPVPVLPRVIRVNILSISKKERRLQYEQKGINLMEDVFVQGAPDGFDTLIKHQPDKLRNVQQALKKFVNGHLQQVGREVVNFEQDLTDGTILCLLIGCLENYFIPLYMYHPNPATLEEKVENVTYAFDLMESAGLEKPYNSPAEIVQGELSAILRIVYQLYVKYDDDD